MFTLHPLLTCFPQEKSYNPYYTLVGQHLCRTSHSHRVTLQYCLWDFLRELGETGVGGSEVIKQSEEFGDTNDGSGVSNRRLSNMSVVFGWWIAKDAVSLAILKVSIYGHYMMSLA